MDFYFECSFKFKQKQNWLKLIDKLIVTHSLYNYFANYGRVYFICNNLVRKDFCDQNIILIFIETLLHVLTTFLRPLDPILNNVMILLI